MNNISLFLSAALIWGSTWLMITFQLGVVEPIVSVVYRFSLASFVLFGYSYFKTKSYQFSRSSHFLILLQGLLLFGFNYWLTYLGITKINSSLAAILSTSIVYFNVIFAKIFLKDKIKGEVIIGATIGVIGITLIFLPETFWQFTETTLLRENETPSSYLDSESWIGIQLVLLASIFASLGNIVSVATQKRKIPIIQANALGMGYAAILLAIIAFFSGYSFDFDTSISYVASLIYLAVFGSVLAFGAFLTLLGKIGADKAGYISLVYPVIALGFSTVFEDYQWTVMGGIGVITILLGNFIAMGKYKRLSWFSKKK
jgi:drug/metabolite transporter (DMT)-like permease